MASSSTKLSLSSKKQMGAFYTPEPLARLLATEVLKGWLATHPGADLGNLSILDPAAGDGGLLIPFALALAELRCSTSSSNYQTVLADIFTRQCYAADISALALASYTAKVNKLLKRPISVPLYVGDSLACATQSTSVLRSLSPQGFDIILANPPYIGQKGHASLFRSLRANPLWKQYATAKNDLLYYFFYLALHLLKPNGLAGFITTPYFSTAQGGTLLRQTLQQQTTFLRLINFEQAHLFKDARPHTLLSVFQKGKFNTPCRIGMAEHSIAQKNLFYGKDSFLQTRVSSPEQSNLLLAMQKSAHVLGEVAHISNGLMTGCDRAFILTDAQKKALTLTQTEQKKLKPFFKNSDIFAYVPNELAHLWLIDIFFPKDRQINLKQYPHLFAHLNQFKSKLLARKQNNNGIDKQLKLGNFWFASVRRKINFEAPKLVLPQRASSLQAAYTSLPWYASSDVYFISNPQPPYTIWTLLGLLNTLPYSIWFANKGKRKGKLLELYSAPLKEIPIPDLSAIQQRRIDQLAQTIYRLKSKDITADTSHLQQQLNCLVYSLFIPSQN